MAIRRIKQPETAPEQIDAPVNTPTIKDAADRLVDLKAYALTFAGKTGYNPYIWIAQRLAPYIARVESGENTPDLIAAIMSIPKEEPRI